jgi:hypothetical protein
MEIIMEKDYVSLNKRLEKKQGLPKKEISSNQWRGPVKEIQASMLKPKIEPMKPLIKKV